jgi:hypothetical protein
MAYTTIKKPSDYFNTKLYTGNGSTQSITGVGFQPDMTWVKSRSSGAWHNLLDAVRGATKRLQVNSDGAESTETNSLTSFDSDGFTVGSSGDVNGSGNSTVAWNWKANGAGSANTDGTISSTVSANTTSGFSIVKWTGTGSSGTIGHGLGVAPKVVIVKRYSASADWVYYTSTIDGSMDYLYLNLTNAKVDSGNPVPTSSVFQKSDTNGETQIAYCFAEKTGYSKFGSYVGNGNADGTFIYTGFKPAFFLIKNTEDGTDDWQIMDNKRNGYNPQNNILQPNLSDAEGSSTRVDFLSNGVKINSSSAFINGSGEKIIYMAFAEQPLIGDNPATAR